MLKYNKKYTALFFGLMSGILYFMQAIIFDAYIYLMMTDEYYKV